MSPGSETKLTAVLEELHELLDQVEDLDAAAREALAGAASEIQSALDTDPEGGSQFSLLRERIERFEGAHPRLTDVVRRLVDQLSEMGI